MGPSRPGSNDMEIYKLNEQNRKLKTSNANLVQKINNLTEQIKVNDHRSQKDFEFVKDGIATIASEVDLMREQRKN